MKCIFFFLINSILFQAAAQSANGDPPIITAVKAGDIITVEKLITKKTVLNASDSNGATALLWGAGLGNMQIVKLLVQNGASVNISGVIYTNTEKTGYYGNLTGIAASQGHMEILKYLIDSCKIAVDDKEYNPETKLKDGWTALQWAASRGQLEAVKFLLGRGANINARHTTDKGTPLLYAIQEFHSVVTDYLINNGANVNAADNNGATPMVYAALNDDFETCIKLWKHKAGLRVTLANGRTLSELVEERELSRIRDFLKDPLKYNIFRQKTYWDEQSRLFHLWFKKNEFDKALVRGLSAQKAGRMEKKDSTIKYAQLLEDLAWVYVKYNKKHKADSLVQQAYRIMKITANPTDKEFYTLLYEMKFFYTTVFPNDEKAMVAYTELANTATFIFEETEKSYIDKWNELANFAFKKRFFKESETAWLKVAESYKKIKEDSLLAETFDNLFQLKHSIGRYKEAEGYLLQSEPILQKTSPSRSHAIALINLGGVCEKQALWQQAKNYYLLGKEELISIGENKTANYALLMNNLGLLYFKISNYEEAYRAYEESKKIYEQLVEFDKLNYTTTLHNLAGLLSLRGEFQKAEILYQKVLQILEVGSYRDKFLVTNGKLASMYYESGDYSKAENILLKVADEQKKLSGKNRSDYAVTLNQLGVLYKTLGQIEKAIHYFVEAREISRHFSNDFDPNYAASLNNLGELYNMLEMYEDGKKNLLEALKIYKNWLGDSNTEYLVVLNNLASAYKDNGETEDADSLYNEVAQKRKAIHGAESHEYAIALNNLAVLYSSINKTKEALDLYKNAYQIFRQTLGEDHSLCAIILKNLAVINEDAGKIKVAEQYYSMYIQLMKKNMLSVFSSLSETEKNNYIQLKFNHSHTINSFNSIHSVSPSFLINTLDLQLIIKSLSLASTRNLLTVIQNSSDTSLKKLFLDWQAYKRLLSKQYSLPDSMRNKDLKSIVIRAEEIEKELARKSTTFQTQQQTLHIKTTDVQKGLNKDEVSIEFVRFRLYNKKWTDSTMYAVYVLKPNDSIPAFVPLFEEKQLQKLFDSAGTTATAMVSKFYRGLDLGNAGTSASLGKDLYKLVWAPLEPYLKDIKKISYSPAGKLYSIAFHALPVDSTTILMDKYELNQYTSTRQVALRKNQEQNIKIQSVTLFGDAAFTLDSAAIAKTKTGNQNISNIYTPQNRGSRGGVWADLPGTAEEVKKVKQLFDQNSITTKSFTQTTATEENLKAVSGNSPQVLHIATHGFFLPEPDRKRTENISNENTYTLADDPLIRSGLILTGGNHAWSGKTPIEGVEDGIATAYEISQLNLSNTELVVLSACETALGDIKGSEGVFGLQRAFKMAGVKKMIVSLWQVPDKETAELMTTFYNYWLKGKTINEAFAQAQLDMRKRYSPYYWAAFVLVE
jgi:CHAT domain-containing protein/ankyrin repeat protein